jgi:hypothetical protein
MSVSMIAVDVAAAAAAALTVAVVIEVLGKIIAHRVRRFE